MVTSALRAIGTAGTVDSSAVADVPRKSESHRAHRAAVERVLGALRENTDVPLKLADMARIALVSRFHFDRLFRCFTGMPPRQFQCALRIADAKRLLLTSHMTALEVCLSVGYSSLGTFTRRFAEKVGISPTSLRRLVTSEADGERYPGKSPREPDLVDSSVRTGSVVGSLYFPEGFDGIAVVGLYRTPVPQGAPVACAAVTSGTTEFWLTGLTGGDYHALAAVIAKPADALSLLLADVSAVGREAVHVEADRVSRIQISMRPLETTDPPILTAVAPLVLRQFLARSEAHSPSDSRP